jgi:hypothetical protein
MQADHTATGDLGWQGHRPFGGGGIGFTRLEALAGAVHLVGRKRYGSNGILIFDNNEHMNPAESPSGAIGHPAFDVASRTRSGPGPPMFRRKSNRALAFLGLAGLLFLLTFVDAAWLRARRAQGVAWEAELVARLGLTDLCLFPEARYTRHPSQADLHSAFQDHPLGLEHFPSGSILPPPRALSNHANLDRKTEIPD